jgi:hypothetical protein
MQHLIVGKAITGFSAFLSRILYNGRSQDGSGSSNAYAFLPDHGSHSGARRRQGAGAPRAPNLSEHADEILSELGFDSKAIEGLRAKVRAG